MILLLDLCYRKDSLYFREFITPVSEIAGNCRVMHISEKIDLKGYSHIIICGTALMDNGYLDRITNLSWLTESKIPIMGICAGMHLISRAFGAKIDKMHKPSIGMRDIRVLRKNPLQEPKIFQAYSLHSRQVREHESFWILARSSDSIEMIKIKRRKIFGVQFHPEVRNPEIIRNFLRLN